MRRISGWSVALILLVLGGCWEMSSRPPDTYLYIRVIDTQGKDMLDPTTDGYFSKSRIRLYYMIEGVKTPCEQTNSGEPLSGFTIDKGWTRDPFYALRVRGNDRIKDDDAVSLLEFEGKQTDTIRCHFVKLTKKGSLGRDSIYLNSVFVQGPFKDQIESFDIVIR